MTALSHATSRLCQAPASRALAHLSTATGLARWSLGLTDCREVAPGLLRGVSLFDGSTSWVRIELWPERLAVDYHVGPAPERLVARIHARVIAGEQLGYAPQTCLVSLLAWRPADMGEERWQRLVHAHETEIELIQAQLGTQGPQGR
jgi:hypothetical protein